MRAILHLLLIGIATIALPVSFAETRGENPTDVDKQIAKLSAEYLELLEKDRDAFIEDSHKPHLIAFIVHVESKVEWKVIRTIQGKMPSDAIAGEPGSLPPGFYLVGIIRPTSQEYFSGSGSEKRYTLPITGEDWNTNQLMKAELKQLLVKKESNKADMATPRKPSD